MAFDITKYLQENKIELGSIKKAVGTHVSKGVSDIRKTQYDVRITEDGKLDLYTHKEIITEGVKYPSQYDAEAMVELWNALEKVGGGGIGKDVRDLINKIQNLRTNLHSTIFGEKSPWRVEFKGNKKKVVWDKDKAIKIGL